MGGRAAYTFATASVVGSAGLVGYFGWLNALIPAPAVYPILVFIGLEITAQSFMATPKKHYPAVAFACLPALAFLAMNLPGRILSDPALAEISLPQLSGDLVADLDTLGMLSSGFILTSLLWAWALAMIIDRNLVKASLVFVVASILTLFGLIHSPLPGSQVFLPFGPQSWSKIILAPEYQWKVMEFALAYMCCAATLYTWSRITKNQTISDSSFNH
jgi:AGZA family xanthine/uracil permease-like MFS transporter